MRPNGLGTAPARSATNGSCRSENRALIIALDHVMHRTGSIGSSEDFESEVDKAKDGLQKRLVAANTDGDRRLPTFESLNHDLMDVSLGEGATSGLMGQLGEVEVRSSRVFLSQRMTGRDEERTCGAMKSTEIPADYPLKSAPSSSGPIAFRHHYAETSAQCHILVIRVEVAHCLAEVMRSLPHVQHFAILHGLVLSHELPAASWVGIPRVDHCPTVIYVIHICSYQIMSIC